MLVNWTGKGPWAIGHPLVAQKDGKVISKVTTCVPGVNHLEDKFWESVKANPQIQRFIDEGRVVIITDKDDKAKAKANTCPELAGLDNEKLERTLKQIRNKPFLERIKKTDSRPEVRYIVDEQLDSLKIKKKGE